MPNQMLRIVLVFGLDDGKLNFPSLLKPIWNRKNVRLYPIRVGWRDGGSYQPKQQIVLDLVDELLATGDPVAIIGISAGASLAVNVYRLRPQLAGLVNVCGALRLPTHLPRLFAKSVGSSNAFKESLTSCETSQQHLSSDQLNVVLILQPWFDFVPTETMVLHGGLTRRLVGINHTVSIVTAMLLYRRMILKFLKRAA